MTSPVDIYVRIQGLSGPNIRLSPYFWARDAAASSLGWHRVLNVRFAGSKLNPSNRFQFNSYDVLA